jgi:hypothetical protein
MKRAFIFAVALAASPALADSVTPGPYVRQPGDPKIPVTIAINEWTSMNATYCKGERRSEPANMQKKLFAGAQCLLMPGQAAAADYCALMLTFCSEAACEKEFHAQTGRGEGSSPSVSIRGCAENDLDGYGWHVEGLLSDHGQ